MNITRKRLAEIVVEEVRRRLRELVEADEDDGTPTGRRKRPDVASADQDEPPEADVSDSPGARTGSPDVGSPEGGQGIEDDPSGPAVDGDSPDPEAVDQDGDAGEDPSGAVNDDMSGKTVQALSIEPRSDVLPGAKEVVLTFRETTDALRILVTPTGQVKFFWKGSLHDIP